MNKRACGLLFWFIAAIPNFSCAAEQVELAFEPSVVNVSKGDVSRVYLVAKNLQKNDDPLSAYQVEIKYNPEKVTIQDPNNTGAGVVFPYQPLGDNSECLKIRKSDACPDKPWYVKNNVFKIKADNSKPGYIRIAYASNGISNVDESGKVYLAVFDVKNISGENTVVEVIEQLAATRDAEKIDLEIKPNLTVLDKKSPVEYNNQAPIINNLHDVSISQGEQVVLPFVVLDKNNDNVDVVINGNGHNFSSLSNNNGKNYSIAIAPSEKDELGIYTIVVAAKDNGTPSLEVVKEVKVQVNKLNHAPVFDKIPTEVAYEESDSVDFLIHAKDIDGDSVTYRIYGLPEGVSYDPEKGRVFGGVGFNSAGKYIVTVQAKDNGAPSKFSQQKLTFTVSNKNRAPQILLDSDISALASERTEIKDVIVDADDDENLVAGIKSKVKYIKLVRANTNKYNLVISPSNEVNETISFSIQARDRSGAEVQKLIRLEVVNEKPSISGEEQLSIDAGKVGDAAYVVSDKESPSGEKTTLEIKEGPKFVSLSKEKDGHYKINISSKQEDAGSYNISLVATDAAGQKVYKKVMLLVQGKNTEPSCRFANAVVVIGKDTLAPIKCIDKENDPIGKIDVSNGLGALITLESKDFNQQYLRISGINAIKGNEKISIKYSDIRSSDKFLTATFELTSVVDKVKGYKIVKFIPGTPSAINNKNSVVTKDGEGIKIIKNDSTVLIPETIGAEPVSINNNNQVIFNHNQYGYFYNGVSTIKMQDYGGLSSVVYGLNDYGEVVGGGKEPDGYNYNDSNSHNEYWSSFVYFNNQQVKLIGGSASDREFKSAPCLYADKQEFPSIATSINNLGEIYAVEDQYEYFGTRRIIGSWGGCRVEGGYFTLKNDGKRTLIPVYNKKVKFTPSEFTSIIGQKFTYDEYGDLYIESEGVRLSGMVVYTPVPYISTYVNDYASETHPENDYLSVSPAKGGQINNRNWKISTRKRCWLGDSFRSANRYNQSSCYHLTSEDGSNINLNQKFDSYIYYISDAVSINDLGHVLVNLVYFDSDSMKNKSSYALLEPVTANNDTVVLNSNAGKKVSLKLIDNGVWHGEYTTSAYGAFSFYINEKYYYGHDGDNAHIKINGSAFYLEKEGRYSITYYEDSGVVDIKRVSDSQFSPVVVFKDKSGNLLEGSKLITASDLGVNSEFYIYADSSYSENGSIVSFKWWSESSSNGTEINKPYYNFTIKDKKPGEYPINLSIADSSGKVTTSVIHIVIPGNINSNKWSLISSCANFKPQPFLNIDDENLTAYVHCDLANSSLNVIDELGRVYGVNKDNDSISQNGKSIEISEVGTYKISLNEKTLKIKLSKVDFEKVDVIYPVGKISSKVDSLISENVILSDNQQEKYIFEAVGLPEGVYINSNNGHIRGRVIPGKAGNYRVTLRIYERSNLELVGEQIFNWSFESTLYNDSIAFKNVPSKIIITKETDLDIVAASELRSHVSFSLIAAPSFITLSEKDSGLSTLHIPYNKEIAGKTYLVKIRAWVYDKQEQYTEHTVSVYIAPDNQAPYIDSIEISESIQKQHVSHYKPGEKEYVLLMSKNDAADIYLHVNDPDGDTIDYKIDQGSFAGTINIVPQNNGSYDIKVDNKNATSGAWPITIDFMDKNTYPKSVPFKMILEVYDPYVAGSFSLKKIPSLGGGSVYGSAINNNGHIVGWASNALQKIRAFEYIDGKTREIDGLIDAANDYSFAMDINNNDDVVGVVLKGEDYKAFVRRSGISETLPELDGEFKNQGYTQYAAIAINDSGNIIGVAWKYDHLSSSRHYRPFLYSSNEYTDLGVLLNSQSAYVSDINNNGVIVGWLTNGDNISPLGFTIKNGMVSYTEANVTTESMLKAINSSDVAVGTARHDWKNQTSQHSQYVGLISNLGGTSVKDISSWAVNYKYPRVEFTSITSRGDIFGLQNNQVNQTSCAKKCLTTSSYNNLDSAFLVKNGKYITLKEHAAPYIQNKQSSYPVLWSIGSPTNQFTTPEHYWDRFPLSISELTNKFELRNTGGAINDSDMMVVNSFITDSVDYKIYTGALVFTPNKNLGVSAVIKSTSLANVSSVSGIRGEDNKLYFDATFVRPGKFNFEISSISSGSYVLGDNNTDGICELDGAEIVVASPGEYEISLDLTMKKYTITSVSDKINPVAILGGNVVINRGQTVSFDAGASYDPQGEQLTYLWSMGLSGVKPQKVFNDTGVYVISLIVTNQQGLSSHAEQTVTVVDPLKPYVANWDAVFIWDDISGWPEDTSTWKNADHSSAKMQLISDHLWQKDIFWSGVSIFKFDARNSLTMKSFWGQGYGDGSSTQIADGIADASSTSNDIAAKNGLVRITFNDQTLQYNIYSLESDNSLPRAVPIANSNPAIGEDVIFDGSKSYDQDGQIHKYIWRIAVDGSAVGQVYSGRQFSKRFTSPGRYSVDLTVYDDNGDWNTQRITVQVQAGSSSFAKKYDHVHLWGGPTVWPSTVNWNENNYPGSRMTLVDDHWWEIEVTAGENKWDRIFKFDGHQTNTSYWGQGHGDGLAAKGIAPNGFADQDPGDDILLPASGVYRIRFNDLTTQYQVITADTSNKPPVANAGNDLTVNRGSAVTFNGSASTDSDGRIVRYEWSNGVSGVSPSYTFVSAGTFNIRLTVVDDKGAIATDWLTVKVLDTPLQKSYTKINLNISGMDAKVIPMILVSDNNWTLTTVLDAGVNQIKLETVDAQVLSWGDNNGDGYLELNGAAISQTSLGGTYKIIFNDKTKKFGIYSAAPRPNHPPLVNLVGEQVKTENDNVTLQVRSSDPDGDALHFSAENLPDGLSINSQTGLITGVLSYNSAGSIKSKINVTDNAVGAITTTISINWYISDLNRKPKVSAVSALSGMPGFTSKANVTAIDDDGDVLTYSLSSAPDFVSINIMDENKIVVSITPDEKDSGSYPIKLIVSDGKDKTEITIPVTIIDTEVINYGIQWLPLLDGGAARGFDINDGGQIVGYATDFTGMAKSVSWKDGNITVLPLGSYSSKATSINNAGNIAGIRLSDGVDKAYIYSNASLSVLDTIPESVKGIALSDNDIAVIRTAKGSSILSSGKLSSITMPDNSSVSLFGVNQSNQMVGYIGTSAAGYGLIWSSVDKQERITPDGGTGLILSAINDSQVAVGGLALVDGTDAVLYENGSLKRLGRFGAQSAFLTDINNSGDYVGFSHTPECAIARVGGVPQCVNRFVPKDFGWQLLSANAINNKGQIVGYGYKQGTTEQAFVLNPYITRYPSMYLRSASGALTAMGVSGDHKWSLDLALASPSVFTLDVLGDGIFTMKPDGAFEVPAGNWHVIYDENTRQMTVESMNQSPIASMDIANESVIEVGTTLTFNAASSKDNDGSIIKYEWKNTLSPESVSVGEKATWTFNQIGSYQVLLRVTDNSGATGTQIVLIKVSPKNSNPIANAGADINLIEGEIAKFDASGSSDSDGKIISYQWSNGLTGISPTLLYDKSGVYDVELTVTDDKGAQSTDRVRVSVGARAYLKTFPQVYVRGTNNSWANGAMKLVSDYTWQFQTTFGAATNERFKFDIKGDWSQNFGDQNADGIAEQGGADILVKAAGNYLITFNDKDKKYKVEKVISSVPVANAGADITTVVGNLVQFDASTSYDPDGSIVTYSWSNGLTGSKPSIIFNDTGTFVITLTVTDDKGNKATDDISVIVKPVAQNVVPVASAGNDLTVALGSTVVFDASASYDSDGSIVSYLWSNGLSGKVASKVYDTLGSYDVLLTVTDNKGATSTDTVKVTVVAKQFAKVFPQVYFRGTSNSWGKTEMLLTADNTWSLDVNFLSGNSDTFKFDVKGDWSQNYGDNTTDGVLDLAGKNISPSQGPGKYRITLQDKLLKYEINKILNDTPVAVAGTDVVAFEGDEVTFTGSASTAGTGTITSYQWSNGLSGVTAKKIYDQAGTYVVTLTITTSEGKSATDDVTVTIKQKPINQAPIANAGNDVSVRVGQLVQFDASQSKDSDGTITQYAWSNGMVGVKPTYTFNTPGIYELTLQVSDNTGAISTDKVIVTVTNTLKSNLTSLYIRGGFNNWTTTAMTLISDNRWEATISISSGVQEFKFDVLGNWSKNFGDSNGDGYADASGKNIAITQGAGSYKITFNDADNKFTVVKI